MKAISNTLTLTVLVTLPSLAVAHPGHGMVAGLAHYFTPEHVLPVLIAVGVLVYALGRRKDRQ